MAFLLNLSLLTRNPNFGRLFAGQFISFMGTMITGVALPYQIYTLTHSTLMVGLLSLFQLLPLLITALIGGVFADRYHRRFLLFAAETILALGSLFLAWNAYQPSPSLLAIFIAATIMAAFNGLHRPALESMVQQIVDKKDFGAVGALATFKGSVSMIVGPAIGGLLIAHFGLVTTYIVDVATFVFSLMALLAMSHIPKPSAAVDESTWMALKTGVRYAFSRQELLGTYLIDFMAMIFGMPTALFPAIALSYGNVKILGYLYAAPAVGALLISFFSGWTRRFDRHGVAIALAATGWGIAIIFFGFSHHLVSSLIFLAIAGAFDGISGIYRSIMWNETIPNTLRGRLAGIEMISYLSGPRLGDTEAGLIAAAFGITTSIVSGGALCVVSVLLSCWFLPKFWHYRSSVHDKI